MMPNSTAAAEVTRIEAAQRLQEGARIEWSTPPHQTVNLQLVVKRSHSARSRPELCRTNPRPTKRVLRTLYDCRSTGKTSSNRWKTLTSLFTMCLLQPPVSSGHWVSCSWKAS